MNRSLKMYNALSHYPLGKWIYSRLLCLTAPYFSTIRPRFIELRPGYGEIMIRNRRSVRNHLGSVHAIAMCNLCELIGGLTLDASIPGHLRWIPGGMEVQYLKIAKSDLTGTCSIDRPDSIAPGRKRVDVSIRDRGGSEVFRGAIDMHISEKKRAS